MKDKNLADSISEGIIEHTLLEAVDSYLKKFGYDKLHSFMIKLLHELNTKQTENS